ncbi:hypothetical protein ACOYW6_07750 [Parablastomonas sp. CN1-191]|uniref:hypothetical protein n=1 Tax=Parablastomonas sp. CN1-191 TaxID=3400908 RepID=UPI003BF7AB5C
MTSTIDLSGQKFGDWVVLARSPTNYRRHAQWLCRCSCGVEKIVLGNNLRRNISTSCGHASRTAGGLSLKYLAEYQIWSKMLARYGERGKHEALDGWVCERWRSFENFVKDMGHRPFKSARLNRIDMAGPYSPDNCRWIDARLISRSQRSVRELEHDGLRLSIGQWSEKLGVPERRISGRLSQGWSVERALTQKPRRSPAK